MCVTQTNTCVVHPYTRLFGVSAIQYIELFLQNPEVHTKHLYVLRKTIVLLQQISQNGLQRSNSRICLYKGSLNLILYLSYRDFLIKNIYALIVLFKSYIGYSCFCCTEHHIIFLRNFAHLYNTLECLFILPRSKM